MPKTILLADDSVTIQKVVELTFMDGDYDVVAVSNGDEAIAHLDSGRPDFVIADVHMPGADGYEVCEHAKERYPQVPALLLVGTFEPFDAQRAEECGAGGHLKKPFDSQELLRRVEEMSHAEEASPAPEEAASHEGTPIHAVEEPAGEAEEPRQEAPAPSITPLALHSETQSDEDRAEEEDTAVGWSGAATDAEEAPDFSLEEGDEAPATLVAPPAETAEEEPTSAPQAAAAASPTTSPLSDEDLERLAQRVVEHMSDKVLREVAWEVLPDLAEVVIKERIRQLEAEVE